MNMLIKVCGMREPANLASMLALPIDLVGFIFYKKSPRFAESKALRQWIARHPDAFGPIKKVGIFVNAEVEVILNAVHDYQLDYVQLHGAESPEYCMEILTLWQMGSMRSAKLIKAFPVDAEFDFSLTRAYEKTCTYFLFDTKTDLHGGSGARFDWGLLSQYQGETPFLLSGGLGPDDATAVREVRHPQLAGIDLNSCFETEPGVKDIEKLAQFVTLIRKESSH